MTATAAPPDPDALVAEAHDRRQAACTALAAAEADPGSVTAAQLAKLRQEADHAQLLVPAAERQAAKLRAEQREAAQAAVLDRIRTEGVADLDRADDLIAALDTLDSALRTFAETAYAYNQSVTHWARLAGNQRPGSQITASPKRDAVTIGEKTYRHLEGGRLVGSLLYRALHGYPDAFLRHRGPYTITHEGDPYGRKNMRERMPSAPDTDLNLHDLIRRDA